MAESEAKKIFLEVEYMNCPIRLHQSYPCSGGTPEQNAFVFNTKMFISECGRSPDEKSGSGFPLQVLARSSLWAFHFQMRSIREHRYKSNMIVRNP
jgi:hypothetical protein